MCIGTLIMICFAIELFRPGTFKKLFTELKYQWKSLTERF